MTADPHEWPDDAAETIRAELVRVTLTGHHRPDLVHTDPPLSVVMFRAALLDAAAALRAGTRHAAASIARIRASVDTVDRWRKSDAHRFAESTAGLRSLLGIPVVIDPTLPPGGFRIEHAYAPGTACCKTGATVHPDPCPHHGDR